MKLPLLSSPINCGRRSKIYDLGKNKVLKLYDADFSSEKIQREFTNTLVVYKQTDLLVAEPFERVEIGKQQGIVMQRLEGTSYMDVFQKNPILYFTKAKTLADIHMQIHTHKAKGIKTQQKVFGSLLKNSKRLTQKEKRHLLAILDQPQSMKLCHGDFHHGNLLLTKLDRVYILDWMDAFMGDPVLDIALTAVNAAVSDAPEHVPMMYRKLYEVLKRILALDQRILAQYPGIENDHLSTQLLLAAGIHLAQREGDYRSHRKYFGTLLEKHTYFVGYNQTK